MRHAKGPGLEGQSSLVAPHLPSLSSLEPGEPCFFLLPCVVVATCLCLAAAEALGASASGAWLLPRRFFFILPSG